MSAHVAKINFFKFRYLEFSFGYLLLLQISLAWIFKKDHKFSLRMLQDIFQKVYTFLWSIHKNKYELWQINFCFNCFCTIL